MTLAAEGKGTARDSARSAPSAQSAQSTELEHEELIIPTDPTGPPSTSSERVRRSGLDSPLGSVFDVGVSIAGLILAAPLMLAIAWVIRRGTSGPALFFQQRVGKDGRYFTFVKFRTMWVDARERFPELYRYKYTDEEIEQLKFKLVEDPRVTPEGRWLRKTSLDELPNLWNVVCRHMSLVGPRPEIPEMLIYYKGRMKRKFDVRPGITGYAQISGRGRLSFIETVEHDLRHLEERSFRRDLKILLTTVRMIITRDGAF